MNLLLMRDGYPITVIRNEDRHAYYDALERADLTAEYQSGKLPTKRCDLRKTIFAMRYPELYCLISCLTKGTGVASDGVAKYSD